LGQVHVFIRDASLGLQPLHHRVVQMPFRREVAIDRALADTGAFGDGLEGQVPPAPGLEPVHELAASGDDALARARRLLLARAVVVSAPAPY